MKKVDVKESATKGKAILNEFNDFINRGNVVDMAVGVVIGSAFGNIVTSLVNDIIMPLVGLLAGGVDFSSLNITIPNLFGLSNAAVISYGSFIQNVVDFLIIAVCVFFFVRFINRLSVARDKLKKKEAEATANAVGEASGKESASDAEMLAVLKDIRAELKKQNK